MPTALEVKRVPESEGLLYQTGAQFEASSGITGTPMVSVTPVQMMLWVVESGYLDKWSRARLVKLVE